MRLESLTPRHVRRAVEIYLEHAWPPDQEGRARLELGALEAARGLEELLACFERPPGDGPASPRHTLRLGNWRYPFMKLVLQEYLLPGEYFFSVDTHDDLRVDSSMPDYLGWQEVRAHNRRLKQAIEAAWARADLPTHENLRELMRALPAAEAGPTSGAGRLLIVDDERGVAHGLEAALQALGYEVELAFDGREVLARLEQDPLPDLVLLDYSMPELDGEEVLRRLRRDARCAGVPILLATASTIDLSAMQRRCGLLRKPYPLEVLSAMIRQLLGERRGLGGAERA